MKSEKKIKHLLARIEKIFSTKIKNIIGNITTKIKKYYLGKKSPGIYFTLQEARCMKYLLQGFTYKKVGSILNLSPRTVMFYTANMQSKLGCTSKDQLIEKVRTSAFLIHLPTLK